MRMRSMLMVAVASMLMAGTAMGQSSGNRVSVVYSLSPRPHLTVTNNYSSPLIGMVIVMSTADATHRIVDGCWFDSGTNFVRQPPLKTGQSYSWPVGPLDEASDLQPRLMAVAFEDSKPAGDPQWLHELHVRRQAAYDEIGVVTTLLNQAVAQDQPSAQIDSTLRNMKDALEKNKMQDAEARVAASIVLETATVDLESAGAGGASGDGQKTIGTTILPLFAEWRAALERYDRTIK